MAYETHIKIHNILKHKRAYLLDILYSLVNKISYTGYKISYVLYEISYIAYKISYIIYKIS